MFKKKDGSGKAFGNRIKSWSVYIIVAVIALGTFAFLWYQTISYREDIDVIGLKADVGPGTLVTEDMLVLKKMASRDYDVNTTIPWEARKDFVVNKYAAVYIAQDVALRDTWFMGDSSEKLKYMKEMKPNEELATIPYDSGYAGGNLVKPGDHLRVYAAYTATDSNGTSNKNVSVETLFEDATVTDLLNTNKNSILSIIEDAQSLPLKDREELMKSDNFKQDLSPKYLMIILKKDQALALKKALASEKMQLSADILTRNRPEGQKDIITGNLLSTYLKAGANGNTNTSTVDAAGSK